eukprot:m.36657 g.36657  ORF g.36657 m.36657 type:complete len:75 (-) comp5429_c0_seq1:1192-1416(-)
MDTTSLTRPYYTDWHGMLQHHRVDLRFPGSCTQSVRAMEHHEVQRGLACVHRSSSGMDTLAHPESCFSDLPPIF